jgi:hypothetical protein
LKNLADFSGSGTAVVDGHAVAVVVLSVKQTSCSKRSLLSALVTCFIVLLAPLGTTASEVTFDVYFVDEDSSLA